MNRFIGITTDNIAGSFGAEKNGEGIINTFWWKSTFQLLNDDNAFIVNVITSGVFLFAIMIAILYVTPSKWKNKGVAMGLTPIVIFPLNFLRLGFQKWGTWAVANGNLKDIKPLLYLKKNHCQVRYYSIFYCLNLTTNFPLIMVSHLALSIALFFILIPLCSTVNLI